MKNFLRQVGQVVIPVLTYIFMRLVWLTTFKKFHFTTSIGEEQHICVCWHGELFMAPQAYRYIHKKQSASAIISQHFDGEIVASTLSKFGIKPLRGSSRKGAQKVLLQAFRSIKKGEEVLITPDGQKGPRHTIDDGAIGLALKSNLPVFVINFTAQRFWQLSSWDKLVIPKPFSGVDFYIESISLEGMELNEARNYLRDKMLVNTVH